MADLPTRWGGYWVSATPHPAVRFAHGRPPHKVGRVSPAILAGRGTYKNARQRPTLPSGYPDSTIGAGGLNFRVRKGNGCLPSAIVTERGKLYRRRVYEAAFGSNRSSIL